MIRGIANFDFQMFDLKEQEKISVSEACKRLREMGYTHMEAGYLTLTEETLAAYRENGLGISNIYCGIDFSVPEDEICAKLDALILRAAEVGAPYIMPLPMQEPEDLTFVWRILQSRADLAAKNNVTMILEDFDFPDQSYRSIAGVKAYMDHVPALRCCFDTGNFQVEGDTIAAAWSVLSEKTVHLHLKDRKNRREPTPVGTGKLGLLEFVKARLAEGYNGFLALEQSPVNDQLSASRISIENIKSIL